MSRPCWCVPGYVKTGFQQHVTAGQAPERMVRARRMAITAAECALAIRRGVERDARTIVTPQAGLAAGGAGAAVSFHCGSPHGGDERNGMNLKLKRTPGIYVVGFMASGKSTIGRHLAHRLGWNFFDTDDEIEAAEKMTIAEIFEHPGRGRVPAHRNRDHPPARALDRAWPAGGAGAGRRRLRRDRATVTCCRTMASPSGWIAPSKSSSGAWGRRRTGRWRAIRRRSRALFEARREAYRLADIHISIESDDPEVAVGAIVRHPLFQ